jgi:hypothetical protein
MRLRALIVSIAMLAAIAAVPATANAQVQSRAADSRAWVDINFGLQQSAQSAGETFTFPFILFLEAAEIGAIYDKPSSGMPFDIGGGYMFHPRVGVGASFTRTTSDVTSTIFADIPDPDFFNNNGFDTDVTDALARTETAFNIHAMFVLVSNDRFTIRAHAGPTFFSYKADMVFNVNWSQQLIGFDNIITVTGYTTQTATGRGVGFHAGADFNYFFTDVVGVGGGVRIARGNVTVDREPMSELEQKIKVGGTQVLFGLRLRFGGGS